MLIIEYHVMFSSLNLPLSSLFLCHWSINLSVHMIDQFTLSVALEYNWSLPMTSSLTHLQIFIGWVCRFSEVGQPKSVTDGNKCGFCPWYIFTTCRKSNQYIVLLQPSIIDDSIQARQLWAGLLGSVIHSVMGSGKRSGGKEDQKQEEVLEEDGKRKTDRKQKECKVVRGEDQRSNDGAGGKGNSGYL